MIVRWLICFLLTLAAASPVRASDEVIVLAGIDNTRAWLEREQWWGEVNRAAQLTAPYALMTSIPPAWKTSAADLPVPDKKEVFYRFLLPLVLHANALVMHRRGQLEEAQAAVEAGQALDDPGIAEIREFARLLRVLSEERAAALSASGLELEKVLGELLYRLDVIPPGLALGQAAYESGYGTSRFALEGNALFGQWTFGGEGLKPEQQRKSLGDHRIAAYDWPFDSVRAYYINLMSHPAYEPFRKLRAELRAGGRPLSSLALADGLTSYSERGQAYVDTLKSIIRVNNLEVADRAVLRDEPRRFLVGAQDEAEATQLRAEIEVMRRSGELEQIIERMDLDLD